MITHQTYLKNALICIKKNLKISYQKTDLSISIPKDLKSNQVSTIGYTNSKKRFPSVFRQEVKDTLAQVGGNKIVTSPFKGWGEMGQKRKIVIYRNCITKMYDAIWRY